MLQTHVINSKIQHYIKNVGAEPLQGVGSLLCTCMLELIVAIPLLKGLWYILPLCCWIKLMFVEHLRFSLRSLTAQSKTSTDQGLPTATSKQAWLGKSIIIGTIHYLKLVKPRDRSGNKFANLKIIKGAIPYGWCPATNLNILSKVHHSYHSGLEIKGSPGVCGPLILAWAHKSLKQRARLAHACWKGK